MSTLLSGLRQSAQAKLGLPYGRKQAAGGCPKREGPAGVPLPSPQCSELGLAEGEWVPHHHAPLAGCLVTREVEWWSH